MVKEQDDKKKQAADEFALYLSEDTSNLEEGWQRQLSDALKKFAVKYNELSPVGADGSGEWHDYFVMGLKKFLRELPPTTTDLEKALEALNRDEVAAEAQDCPAKRVKHGNEDATTSRGGFTVETEGSLTFRISDDTRTSTFNLNGRGPAIVTVNVQNKLTTALASTNGNKEAKKEGAA